MFLHAGSCRCGATRMYRCRDCRRKFSHNLGFEKMMATPGQITMAMDLYFNCESSSSRPVRGRTGSR